MTYTWSQTKQELNTTHKELQKTACARLVNKIKGIPNILLQIFHLFYKEIKKVRYQMK